MTEEEIEAAIKFLRDFNYPVPQGLSGTGVSGMAAGLQVGICKIAVEMCDDF